MLTNPRLRRRLSHILRVDSDFDAFCLDFFPHIHERFSGSMDRVAKTSLLLSLAGGRAVEKALASYGAYGAPGTQRSGPLSSPRSVGLAAAAGLLLVACLGAWIYTYRLHGTSSATSRNIPEPAPAAPPESLKKPTEVPPPAPGPQADLTNPSKPVVEKTRGVKAATTKRVTNIYNAPIDTLIQNY